LKDRGPSLQETLSNKTAQLVERLNALFASRGVTTTIESYASWFYFNLHAEHPLSVLLFYHLRERGIHIQDGFPCFLTTAHSDADIERVYAAFESAVNEMNLVGILGTQVGAAIPGPNRRAVPLTESQIEIWLAAQLSDEASCAFNESISLRMHGELNQAALQAAMTELLARHDALRTTFSSTGEEMFIAAPRRFTYPLTDFSGIPIAQTESAYAELADADARCAFDLVNGPTVRAHLVKIAENSHVLMLTAHHIVCDGWSINLMVSELAEIYSSACRGESSQLAPAMQFSAYAAALAQRNPELKAATERYWLDEFKNPVPSLELPTDRPRPEIKSFSGASLCRHIDAGLYQSLKKSGARHGSTLFATLLAAFQTLMGRLGNQSEVVVGVPTAGQSMIEDQALVGHCVNFLPIRGEWNRDTVAEFLAKTSRQVLDAYEHQEYTFGTLVRKLNLRRESGRLPLTEIQFNLERLSDRLQVPGLTIDVAPNPKAHVNFDLFLNVIESASGLRLDLDYNTDLFDENTVGHWLDCYRALLESFVANTTQPLIAAPCVPAAELAQLLGEFNHTATNFPLDQGVHHLIEAQAAATPEAIAAQFGAETLSYAALDRRANQLAHVIRNQLPGGSQTGPLVGVCCERSLDMLVALIAIHKAGCAYVPLDPLHPPDRLRYILGEARVAALITDSDQNTSLVGNGVAIINFQRDQNLIATAPSVKAATTFGPMDLAYVIYTSGSTGQPKGVEITHRSVVNLLCSMAKSPGLTRSDVLFAVTTISFDIAALELFLPLIVGAKVVIAARETVMDGDALLKELQGTRASHMQATPAGWRLLLEAGFRAAPGFKMLCGGEALPADVAQRLLEGAGELWNMYGPTETTIWSSCTRVTNASAPITVGGPIDNTQFYILDRHDQPLPTGVPGQLHIGGEGVARGYYQRRELTADKFLVNPFAAGRLYRTGDLARWLPEGGVQILGRMDHQIKLRGFRIELGEVESVFINKSQVTEVTVILREDKPGSPRLVAYYTDPAGARPADEFRELLATELPDYMIPSAFVWLSTMPLSPNGKLDRAALPVPDSAQVAGEEYVAPVTATQKTLTNIFAEVLQLDRIGANADLLRMGADSIQIFQITARANRAGLKITAKQLLEHRNAASLGDFFDSKKSDPGTEPRGSAVPTLSQFQRPRRSSSTTRH
jgi:amino acid adenylation domain-containing protein